ncbi:lysine-2,3-aminomutase-like protein [Candidatus Viadribacter manganicus]|uniref:Lysine 2,3-aminomutase n=1 Tax=Candidatus Viadribacter manganicus TaxID=1759059 RepID=A0A1B1AIW9_9PROT|nr:lysine-2,3-aminomutase-like protein [Candidatus Viadribacter manganicus]ANP46470.1 lysine 2,3-aminomutase [Candidatus Viadribacter manganicus]
MSAKAKIDPLAEVASRYAVAITSAMEALIDPTSPNDPIAAQFQPDARELETALDELSDPIGDDAHTPVKGVVHRYPDRALLKLVHVCPVYCRFCFRREMVGPDGDGTLTGAELEAALSYIESQPSIWEVILTGGDPFLLSARRVREITARLAAIAHVKIIRWHTRIPAVDPMRVTPDLVEALRVEGATTYVVLHTNHVHELTDQARAAIARIVDSGVPMLSQTVLLRDVNDDVDTLEALMRALVEARVKPYYLHHLDKAPGTSHFRCTIERGQELAQALHERASGLAQPAYVLDIPGGHGKAPLAAQAVRETDDGYEVRDRDGVWRAYKE